MNLQSELERIKSQFSPDKVVIVLGQDFFPEIRGIEGFERIRLQGVVAKEFPNAYAVAVWRGFLVITELASYANVVETRKAMRPGAVYLAIDQAIDASHEKIANANERYYEDLEDRQMKHASDLKRLEKQCQEKIAKLLRGKA